MWRLVSFGIIIYLAILAFKRHAGSKNNDENHMHKKEASPQKEDVEDMVQCANCAVHLPRSGAYLANGKFYCSRAHIAQ